MGSINVGFVDNRNSSRVLKPPGGETSDIFGTAPAPIHKAEVRKTLRPECAVQKILEETIPQNGFKQLSVNNTKSEDKQNGEVNGSKSNEKDEQEPISNGKQDSTEKEPQDEKDNSTPVPEEPIKTEAKQQAIPEEPIKRKSRIPPGGYSSGLW